MLNYLFKILALLLFSAFIVYYYYFVYSGHLTSFEWYSFYAVLLLIWYWIYKFFQLSKSKEIAYFKNIHILGYFLLNLLLVCLTFFFFVENPSNNFIVLWITLFFKILFFSLVPIIIFIFTTSFWAFILDKIPNNDKDFSPSFNLLLSLWLWFALFVTLLVILWSFGLYNIFVVLIILWVFWWFWRNNAKSYKNSFLEKDYKINIKEWSYLKFLTTEFFVLLAFFVLSVALVSIFRPFPIWWDDLWVYMNYPHLMAEAWNILSLSSIYSWQVFTGIWYMLWNATFAFFVNISGLFISFIVLNIVFNDLLKSKNLEKKSYIDLPIILSTLFIALPMTVFLTTKDMKVDAWLFFVTVIWVYAIIKYFLYERDNNWKKLSLFYIFIIWILAWFAFSIKFTALFFIIWIISIISYARIWLLGFLGFLSFLLGFFTIFDFWAMMNVIINPYNIPNFEITFWISAIILWATLLWIWFFVKKDNLIKFLKEILIFIVWVIFILTPWFAKNIVETFPNFWVREILNGSWDRFHADYTKIYTQEEINQIRQDFRVERKTENAITTNEDLLRYFGYEEGILDFVYMPWNLTMQKNQAWEYTDIWFLFLALIPLIFIFLSYKKPIYPIFFVVLALLQIISYLPYKTETISWENISQIPEENLSRVLTNNTDVFDLWNNPSIYDINFSKYVTADDLAKTFWEDEIADKTREYIVNVSTNQAREILAQENSQSQERLNELISQISTRYLQDFENYQNLILQAEVEKLAEETREIFYEEISQKITNSNTWGQISFLANPLDEQDIDYLDNLITTYNESYIFQVDNLWELKNILDKNNFSSENYDLIVQKYKDSRNIPWKIVDLFSVINIPVWYFFLFIWFFIPTLYLIFTLKKTRLNYIFTLNLVFASIYTFLWLVSSFGIVWYWITMYFSFLLMIWLAWYNIINYEKYENNNKSYLLKLFWAFIFLSIFLVYVFNSIIPNTFNNLKNAWYKEYKSWQITSDSAIFLYHNDYIKILYTLNIAEDKKKDFLQDNISSRIIEVTPEILDADIDLVFSILNSLERGNELWQLASNAKQNLYKNIANPSDDFKNKQNIYRVGTFLRYYISENNTRLLEDSLLFNFNDYIYANSLSDTINNFKAIDIKYLLLDLNAATIDQSSTKDLTNRYEKLLETFVSNDIELISTDSVCLKIWLDQYEKNNSMNEYLRIAWINYDSFDSDWNIIPRWEKRLECAKFILNLLENNSIDENNFSYLQRYKNYFSNREVSITAINNLIWTTYKALFEIK